MMQRKAQALINPYGIIIIIMIASLLIGGIQQLLGGIYESPHANMDDASREYYNAILGVEEADLLVTSNSINTSTIIKDNETGGTPKDDSREFSFAEQKASSLEGTLNKGWYINLPRTFIVTILGAPQGEFQWMLDVFNYLFWITFVIMIILFVRGIVK